MEKVILTEEQAFCIEDLRGANRAWMIGHQDKRRWHKDGAYKSLNSLSLDQFLKAFYAGYEIEKPKYKPGDKVVRETGGEFLFNQLIVEVIGVSKNQWFEQQIEYEIEGCSYFLGSEYVRHATPEEIYWLETLGREKVGEFRIGDVVLAEDGVIVRITTEYLLAQTARTFNEVPEEIIGIYPEESFAQFPKESKS